MLEEAGSGCAVYLVFAVLTVFVIIIIATEPVIGLPLFLGVMILFFLADKYDKKKKLEKENELPKLPDSEPEKKSQEHRECLTPFLIVFIILLVRLIIILYDGGTFLDFWNEIFHFG